MRKVLAYGLVAVAMAFMLNACSGVTPEGASSNIFTGSMVSEEAVTITEIHAATLKALEALELPVSYDKKDNLVAVLQTFTAEGQTIRISISYRSVDVSELKLFSEDSVDSYKMAGLMDEIRNQMSLI